MENKIYVYDRRKGRVSYEIRCELYSFEKLAVFLDRF